MIQIDGYYLYSTGHQIHPLSDLRTDAPFTDWALTLYIAQGTLDALLKRSIFQLQACQTAGNKLLQAIQTLTNDSERTAPIDILEAYRVTSALSEFEHVLTAELGMMNIYMVEKRRGYDTSVLIHNGTALFPADLITKVPEAILDVDQATRCIAFDLPTAAGFHLHRANESVLHRYYDVVTGGAPRPETRNIGDYLSEMKTRKVGDEKVLSALKDLKDLHRNPLIHPEDSLENIDDAIALLGSIQAVVVPMLKAIPDPEEEAAPPPPPA